VSGVHGVRSGVQRGQVVREGRGRAAQAKLKPTDLTDAALDLSREVYLTLAQAARYLKRSVGAVKMLKKRGVIPPYCYTYLGGSLLFIREALDELLQKKERLQLARSGSDAVHGERG